MRARKSTGPNVSPPNKHRLNDLFISRLQPKDAGPYLVWDTIQHGLAVQTQPTGHKASKLSIAGAVDPVGTTSAMLPRSR